MRVHKPKRRKGRTDRRFRPGPWSHGRDLETALELEARVLLSARAAAMTNARHAHAPVRRVTPAAEINAQYNAFASDFQNEEAYVASLQRQQTSGTMTVGSTTLTQAFTAGSTTMQVANASVFGPSGTFTPPFTATALAQNQTPEQFSLLNRTGNTLSVTGLNFDFPIGAIIQATLTSLLKPNAASIFPSFITNRTNQMAIDLVQYFNGLPLKLPFFNTPPHTPNNRGAIQSYVYNSIAGSGSTSLQQSLLAIPLPTTAGYDLQIYNATVASAIEQSRIQTLNGVSEIYAGQLRVAGPIPNNRYGANVSGTVPAYILAPS